MGVRRDLTNNHGISFGYNCHKWELIGWWWFKATTSLDIVVDLWQLGWLVYASSWILGLSIMVYWRSTTIWTLEQLEQRSRASVLPLFCAVSRDAHFMYDDSPQYLKDNIKGIGETPRVINHHRVLGRILNVPEPGVKKIVVFMEKETHGLKKKVGLVGDLLLN